MAVISVVMRGESDETKPGCRAGAWEKSTSGAFVPASLSILLYCNRAVRRIAILVGWGNSTNEAIFQRAIMVAVRGAIEGASVWGREDSIHGTGCRGVGRGGENRKEVGRSGGAGRANFPPGTGTLRRLTR